MEVFHCETGVGVEMPAYSGPCDRSPKEISVCSRVIGAWAMGAEPLRYPEEAGFPIGGPDFNLYVRLEMHYNNPELKAGSFKIMALVAYSRACVFNDFPPPLLNRLGRL